MNSAQPLPPELWVVFDGDNYVLGVTPDAPTGLMSHFSGNLQAVRYIRGEHGQDQETTH